MELLICLLLGKTQDQEPFLDRQIIAFLLYFVNTKGANAPFGYLLSVLIFLKVFRSL